MQNDNPDPDADVAPADHLKTGVRKACDAIIADPKLSTREKIAKIKAYLMAHEKLAADAKDADDEPADNLDDLPSRRGKKGGKADAAVESLTLLMKLGRGNRRLAERGRRPGLPAVVMTAAQFARLLRRGSCNFFS